MSEVKLQVEKRETRGKEAAKKLRREGKIPGIYYFQGQEAIALAVDEKQLHGVVSGEGSVVDLQVGKGKILPSIIKDVQWHPVTSEPVHVDFLGVKLDEAVVVEVPLSVVGTSKGVKNAGGVLQQVHRYVEVECLPLDIPEHIEVDISDLDINDTVHASDLHFDKGQIVTDPDTLILSILPPRVEVEVEEEEAVPEGEEEAEPEVVGKGKKEQEEEE